jgi:hypothetical protein
VEKFRDRRGTASGRLAEPQFRSGRNEETLVNLRACSACAGDYEDPDRSLGPDGDEVDDEGEVVNNVEERGQE